MNGSGIDRDFCRIGDGFRGSAFFGQVGMVFVEECLCPITFGAEG